MFHSPKQAELETAFQEFLAEPDIAVRIQQNTLPPIKMIKGEPQLSYYGRFQLALQAPTPYVAIIDDDWIPGNKYFSHLIHTINTDIGNSILGARGHSTASPELGSIQMVFHPPHLMVLKNNNGL